MIRVLALMVTATVIGTGVTTGASVDEAAEGLDLDRLRAATVLISADPSDPTLEGWGSGSIIDADGLILTNAHVAADTAPGLALLYPEMLYEPDSPDELYVYTVDGDGGSASPAYRAEVVAADGYLDLAVLRIVADVDGARVDPDELDLTPVPIGQTRELRPLDELIVTGFPGIAETFAVRFSKGEVHNFSDDPRVGPDAWIHTDAKIAEGSSGGLAADASGHLVAIPTMVMSDGPDGAVDYNMRPVELALPLIEAARAGRPYDGYRYLARPTGDEFARVQGWASEFTEECVGGNAEPAFPSGTWELFPQVRFAGMSDGNVVLVELVELSGRTGEVEVRDNYAFEWDAEWGTSDCLPFELWYDRSVSSGEYRSFRDGDYGVRVRVGLGRSDMSEISEDARLTAVTVGPTAVATTELTDASSAASASAVDASEEDEAVHGSLRIEVTGHGGGPPDEWDAVTVTRRIIDGTARIDEVRPHQAAEPSADGVFPTWDVVVAARYLESGFPIDADMLDLRPVLIDDTNAGAYVDVAEVVGWVPAVDILTTQPITPNLLVMPTAGSTSDPRVPLEVVEHGMSKKGDTVNYAIVLRNPNEGRWSAERMPVRVRAVDRRGRVTATTREMASLLPGQTGAVVGEIPGAKGAVAIEVAVADDEGSWAEQDLTAGGLDLWAVKASRNGSRPVTRGRLEAWFGDWQEGVQVMAVYRDGQGRIIGGDSAFLRVVPGGESIRFRILGSGRVPARAIKSTEVFYEL